MCHEIQNEILRLMSDRLLNEQIMKNIHQAKFYTIMCDETTDVSNCEQAAICIRTVDDKFNIREDFIGLKKLECTKSDFIFNMLTATLNELNLSVTKMRGQCYDGRVQINVEF